MKPQLLHAALTVLAVIGSICTTPVDMDTFDDTMPVGSYIRVVRAAAPLSYHISHEDDGDGELGYSRKKSDGGKQGYQKFESFHKKAGDAYEFEKHDSYGQDEKGKKDGDDGEASYSHRIEKKAEKLREAPYDEDVEVIEDENDEEKKDKKSAPYTTGEEDSDSYGPSGYDEEDSANYQIPSSYSYGEGDDYNF